MTTMTNVFFWQIIFQADQHDWTELSQERLLLLAQCPQEMKCHSCFGRSVPRMSLFWRASLRFGLRTKFSSSSCPYPYPSNIMVDTFRLEPPQGVPYASGHSSVLCAHLEPSPSAKHGAHTALSVTILATSVSSWAYSHGCQVWDKHSESLLFSTVKLKVPPRVMYPWRMMWPLLKLSNAYRLWTKFSLVYRDLKFLA